MDVESSSGLYHPHNPLPSSSSADANLSYMHAQGLADSMHSQASNAMSTSSNGPTTTAGFGEPSAMPPPILTRVVDRSCMRGDIGNVRPPPTIHSQKEKR